MKRKFPVLGVFLVVAGFLWFMNEMNLVSIKIPWLPIVVVVVGIGMIYNRLKA